MAEIEKCFFKVFSIKPKRQCYYSDTHCKNHCNKDCVNFYMEPKYPEITDRVLLELICILNDFDDGHYESIILEELKQEVLEDLIYYHNAIGNKANQELRDKVLSLFKVGAEDE